MVFLPCINCRLRHLHAYNLDSKTTEAYNVVYHIKTET